MVHSLVAALARDGVRAGVARRAASVLAALAVTSRELRTIKQRCHLVPVAATEDVAGYLLAAAGLRVVTPLRFRLATGNGVDPAIGDLATALAQMARHPAFLLDNVQTSNPLTNEVVKRARSARVPVVDVTETMRGVHYVAWLGGVVARLRAPLVAQGCLA